MKSSRFATKPERPFVLFVPQLEDLLREARRLPPLVHALVRRRRAESLSPHSPQSELACGRAVAAAPLSRRHDRPRDAGGAWLRADPVGLVPDLAAVWLQPEAAYRPGDWQSILAALFEAEGMRLEFTPQGRGYLRLEAVPDCEFTPPWALAGASLEHCLPSGPERRLWRRLLNDTQVELQQLKQAAQSPESIPGSLWFWGAGTLENHDSIVPRVTRIAAEDPVLGGLADWLELSKERHGDPIRPEPGVMVEWPARQEDSAEANLERLQAVLRPAWRELRLGRIRVLELAGLTTRRRYSVADAWRVWR
jgi:hypothetical protein